MERSLRALVILADQAKTAADAATASIDDMLSFVTASNERIEIMEAAHKRALVNLHESGGAVARQQGR